MIMLSHAHSQRHNSRRRLLAATGLLVGFVLCLSCISIKSVRRKLVEEFMAYQSNVHKLTRMSREPLTVTFKNITNEKLGFSIKEDCRGIGVLVRSVSGQAKSRGVHCGQYILRVGDSPVMSRDDLEKCLANRCKLDTIDITFGRPVSLKWWSIDFVPFQIQLDDWSEEGGEQSKFKKLCDGTYESLMRTEHEGATRPNVEISWPPKIPKMPIKHAEELLVEVQKKLQDTMEKLKILQKGQELKLNNDMKTLIDYGLMKDGLAPHEDVDRRGRDIPMFTVSVMLHERPDTKLMFATPEDKLKYYKIPGKEEKLRNSMKEVEQPLYSITAWDQRQVHAVLHKKGEDEKHTKGRVVLAAVFTVETT